MSFASKDSFRSVYREAFSDESLLPSPSSSTSSLTSSPNSDSESRAKNGPPTWCPFKRYPEFQEREKWLKEDNQLNAEEEQKFQRFVHDYKKYKAKDKVGVPFWEELRRSVPSLNFDAGRDERYYVGYDEEGNEVKYNDEKHFLKRVRQSEILEFQAECRKAMKQREEPTKRKDEGKRGRDVDEEEDRAKKATKMDDDISFVGKKQGLWWRKGFRGMNVEVQKVVKMDGELQYVVADKAQRGRQRKALQEEEKYSEANSTTSEDPKILREKMEENKNKRPISEDEADEELKTATKRMNAVSPFDSEKVVNSGLDEELLKKLTHEKPSCSGDGTNTEEPNDDDEARQSGMEDEFNVHKKYSNDEEEEEIDLETHPSSNVRKNKSNNKDDTADWLEFNDGQEDYIMPGFEEEAEFKENENDSGSDIEHLLEVLKHEEKVLESTPSNDETTDTTEFYDSEDIDDEGMHNYEAKAQDRWVTTPKKGEANKEEESKAGAEREVKTVITFRHSPKFQKQQEEKKMQEVKQKLQHDLADIDVTMKLLLMDLQGQDEGDDEKSETE